MNKTAYIWHKEEKRWEKVASGLAAFNEGIKYIHDNHKSFFDSMCWSVNAGDYPPSDLEEEIVENN